MTGIEALMIRIITEYLDASRHDPAGRTAQ
jgi:hypothetical protein